MFFFYGWWFPCCCFLTGILSPFHMITIAQRLHPSLFSTCQSADDYAIETWVMFRSLSLECTRLGYVQVVIHTVSSYC